MLDVCRSQVKIVFPDMPPVFNSGVKAATGEEFGKGSWATSKDAGKSISYLCADRAKSELLKREVEVSF